jgi:hypothetical protein
VFAPPSFPSPPSPSLSAPLSGPSFPFASRLSVSETLLDPPLLLALGVFFVALGLLIVVARPADRSFRERGSRVFHRRRRRVPVQRLKLQRGKATVK